MKKIWISFITVLLSLAMCLGICACDSTETATISVTVNGVNQTGGGTVNVTVGTAYTIAATSSNDAQVSIGYSFGGTDNTLTGSEFTPQNEGNYLFTFTADGATAFNLTLAATAQSTSEDQYTVVFGLGSNAASDAEAIAARTVVAGTVITLPAAPKAANGYTFDGWSDGSKKYEEHSSYTVNSAATLTALWKAQKVTVSYSVGVNAAQGATAPAAQTVDFNSDIQLPPAVSAASGYEFGGWSDGTNTYGAESTYNVKGEVVLTAVYHEQGTVTQYTVSYSVGDHAAAEATVPTAQTVNAGVSVTLPEAPQAAGGYVFDGWSDGTNKYNAKAAYTANATITLTALWTVEQQGGVINGNFETGDLTGWTVVSGDAQNILVNIATTFWEKDKNFWDMNGDTVQYFLQDGKYFLRTDEPASVTVKSATFELGGDGLISFKFGGAMNTACYIALCDATTNEELIIMYNEYCKDPTLPETLLRRIMYANDYIGRNVYIKLVDEAANGFGFITFDDLKVSLTIAEAQAIVATDKVWAATYRQDVLDSSASMGEQTKNIINAIRDYYSALTVTNVKNVYITQAVTDKAVTEGSKDITEYLSEAKGSMLGVQANTLVKDIVNINDGTTDYTSGFETFALNGGKTYTVTYRITEPESEKYVEATFQIVVSSSKEILNGGFEQGLAGWTYEQGTGNGQILGEAAICTDTTFWGEQIPFNNSGKFFNGWNATGENTEGYAYKLTSTTFELGGSGVISFRLGGNATVLKVFKADGTQIAAYSNTQFHGDDALFPHLDQGGRWGTMTSYYADLHEYIGQQLYIELHDTGNPHNTWGFAFFDEIKTYYEGTTEAVLATLSAKKDTVALTCHKLDGELHAEGATYDIAWVSAVNDPNA